MYTVDGDLNDAALLRKLFDECQVTHVLHLAAQVWLVMFVHLSGGPVKNRRDSMYTLFVCF